jgi:hypothetical protein
VAPTADDWLRRLADRLGVPSPDTEVADTLLAIAGIAAHASERTAAPISTWLVASAGVAPFEALAIVKAVAAELQAAGEPEAPAAGEPQPPAAGEAEAPAAGDREAPAAGEPGAANGHTE